MITWQQLLSRPHDETATDYGPNSRVVFNAFDVLASTAWFENIGAPLDAPALVFGSWNEAVQGVRFSEYGPNGHLLKPSEACIAIIESEQHRPWWKLARNDVYDHFGTSECISETWEKPLQDFVHEYVYEFISFLLAEIIGAPAVECCYFREMLAWFHAGRFPAGWDGDWPDGRWRIF